MPLIVYYAGIICIVIGGAKHKAFWILLGFCLIALSVFIAVTP